MRLFRRRRVKALDATSAERTIGARENTGLPRQDAGPILVAVTGRERGWQAVDWAAAEAAARRCALRIVHVLGWPRASYAGATMSFLPDPLSAVATAERVVDEAARHARMIVPELQITTHLQAGATAAGIVQEVCDDALIVLGRRRGVDLFIGFVARQVAHRSGRPVALVGLADQPMRGPSAGRVVVGVDGTAEPMTALDVAFRAAQHRGVGVTAVHPWGDDTTSALRCCADAFPGVEVRQRLVAASTATALVAESAGAALTVVGARPDGNVRRALFGSTERTVLHSVRGPVAIVEASAGVRNRRG